MPARARWSIPEGSAFEDPFGEDAAPVVSPAVVGTRVPVVREESALADLVLSLMDREDQARSAGAECGMKDQYDSCCAICPISQHQNSEHPRHALCVVGREQAMVLTEYNAAAQLKRDAESQG